MPCETGSRSLNATYADSSGTVVLGSNLDCQALGCIAGQRLRVPGGGFAPTLQSGIDDVSRLTPWEWPNRGPVRSDIRVLGLASAYRLANESGGQAKIDPQHPNRDRED